VKEDLVDYIKQKISQAEKKVTFYEEGHGDNPTETYGYYGGWRLGYWEGRIAAFEDILFKIEAGK